MLPSRANSVGKNYAPFGSSLLGIVCGGCWARHSRPPLAVRRQRELLRNLFENCAEANNIVEAENRKGCD